MNACGCHQCGGSTARADALMARRVIAHADYITHRRGMTRAELAGRTERPSLYSRLALRAAAREG